MIVVLVIAVANITCLFVSIVQFADCPEETNSKNNLIQKGAITVEEKIDEQVANDVRLPSDDAEEPLNSAEVSWIFHHTCI